MPRYYVNRAIEMREAGRYTTANERARQIANSYTPQAMSQLVSNIERNPTLPADAQLALASSPQALVDQVATEMAQRRYDGAVNARKKALEYLTGVTSNQDPLGWAMGSVGKAYEGATGVLGNVPGADKAGSVASKAAGKAGDVAGAVGEALGGALPEPVSEGAKAVSRPGMAALDAGPQVVQAGARTLYGVGQDVASGNFSDIPSFNEMIQQTGEQTDFGQMAGTVMANVIGGETWNEGLQDFGDGFFIAEDSELMTRKRAAEAKAATLSNGEVFTIGRGVAHHVGLDRGTWAYNGVSGILDATVAVGTPSIDKGADKLVRAGGRGAVSLAGGMSEGTMLREVGALRGMYDTVDIQKFSNFLTSRRAQPTINFMTNATGDQGWYDIWKATGGKLDNFTVNNLVDATDPDQVRAILTSAAEKGQVFGVSTAPRRALRSATSDARIRMFDGDLPAGRLDLNDAEGAVLLMDQVGATIKAPSEMRRGWVEAMGRAETVGERREVYSKMWGEAAEMLEGQGYQKARAKALTQYMGDQLNTDRILVDEMALMDAHHWGVLSVAGNPIEMPGAFLLSEIANSTLPLPDMRDLKRATSVWKPLFESLDNSKTLGLMREAGFSSTGSVPRRGTIAARALKSLEGAQSVFKTSRLLRVAYPVRVLSWDQARFAAAGYDAVPNHPLRYINSVISSKSGVKVTDEAVDIFGQKIGTWDEFVELTATGNLDGMRGKFSSVASTEKIRVGKNTPKPDEYIKFWQDELATLAVDPITVKAANAISADEVIDWLDTGAGRRYVSEMEGLLGKAFDPNDKFWSDYITSVSSRIRAATGESDELLEVIRSGQGATAVNEMLGDGRLSRLMDEFGPDAVAGFPTNTGFGAAMDTAMDYMFDILATRPSRKYSQLPLFEQAYSKGLIKYAPLAESSDEIMAAAKAAKLSKKEMKVLSKALSKTSAEGTMTLEHIDALAKSFALDETKRLLYDTSKNSQFFDTFRLLTVFGDAWKEEIQAWSSLLSKRPTSIYRQGAQALDASAEAGFFEENADGQMVFNYPFSAEISQLFGTPAIIQGRAAGLSLTGEVLPGLGPMAQIPAAEVIPNTANWAAVRELALPFGDPDAINSTSWVVPPWLDKVLAGGTELLGFDKAWTQGNANTFANRKNDAMRYLMSTGNYDLNDPTSRAKLKEDADNRANRLYLLHGLAQLVSPSAPIPQQQIAGPNGEMMDIQVAVDRYRELQAEDYSTAPIKFLEEFGEENLLLMSSNTRSLTYGGIPMTKDALLWANENQAIIDAHPDLYGFLGPQDIDGEFSFDAYNRALDEGELVRLTDEEKIRLAEHRIGSAIYREYRALIPGNPNEEQAGILREIRTELQQTYPGYGAIDSMGSRTPVWRIIDDGGVDAIFDDPNVERTPTIEVLEEYWTVHETVKAAAAQAGLSTTGSGGWRTSNAGAGMREYLRQEGDRLALMDAGFARMWDEFLVNEFSSDLEG